MAERNGFWRQEKASDDPTRSEVFEVAAKIALIGNEAHELLEAWRSQDPHRQSSKHYGLTDFTEELADIVLRVVDIAAHFDVDLGLACQFKAEYNAGRAFRHGKRF